MKIKQIAKNLYNKLFKSNNYDNLTEDKLREKLKKQNKALSIFRPVGIITIIVIIMFGIYSCLFIFRTVNSNEMKNSDFNKMKELINTDYYETKADYSLPHNQLKDFSIYKDKFTFKNLGSFNSEGGLCLGFSLFEKLNYMNKLKDMEMKINDRRLNFEKRIILGDIFIPTEDIGSIYKEKKSSDVNFLEPSRQIKNNSVELIYDLNIEHKILDDFSNITSEQTISDLLNAVNYLKVNGDDGLKIITIEPYKYINKKEANVGVLQNLFTKSPNNSNQIICKSLSTEVVTNKIDSDEPVVLGFVPYSGSGHAVLGYKYEYIDKNTLKVFVSDSNFPLVRLENKNDEEKYNNEILNNFFVIFKRENYKSRWQYSYNPRINGNYGYMGGYNSYIPQFKLLIE